MTNDNKPKSQADLKRELAAEILKLSPRDQIAVLARNIVLDKRPNPDKIGMGIHSLVRMAFAAGMKSMMSPSVKTPQERLTEWLDTKPENRHGLILPGDTIQ